MSLLSRLSSSVGKPPTVYVDDVFAATTFIGNGADQKITNGIDLAGYGGMVWTKSRSNPYHGGVHDTNRGAGKVLYTSNNNPQSDVSNGLKSFAVDGFALGSSDNANNGNGSSAISWTFRKAPKFFDVVTWTGNGVGDKIVPHNLGIAPGMIWVKCTSLGNSAGYDWFVYHKYSPHSLGTHNTNYLRLNTTAGALDTQTDQWNVGATNFKGAASFNLNVAGATYVAYLFADDQAADSMIKCGQFTVGNNGESVSVNLGFEPQFVLIKNAVDGFAGNWEVCDQARPMVADHTGTGNLKTIFPNLPNVEGSGTVLGLVQPQGFTTQVGTPGGATFIYMAIRRPNKPPESGATVFKAVTYTGSGVPRTFSGFGFSPDLIMFKNRGSGSGYWCDRLRWNTLINPSINDSPVFYDSSAPQFGTDGFSIGTDGMNATNGADQNYVAWCFRRARGVFDIVRYTGIGGTGNNFPNHNLGVIPELIINKGLNGTEAWRAAFCSLSPLPYIGAISSTAAMVSNISTYVTDTLYHATNNTVGTPYVSYLFASKPGISKVFQYTGNGTSQIIDCGFAAGARFVLIKSTASGHWIMFDTTRGITTGIDPVAYIASTIEYTTYDPVDPHASGFVVNQESMGLNTNAQNYVGVAFA